MAQPGYKKEERTGILSNIRNSRPVSAARDWSKRTGKTYDKQFSDAGKSYTQLAKNNTSRFEKKFGESNFSNKAGAIKYGLQDAGGYLYNLAREGVGIGADVVQNANAGVNDLLRYINPFDEALGPGKATQTALTDSAADIVALTGNTTFAPRTDMFEDGMMAQVKYNPASDEGKNIFNSWKSASGFNTTLNADRINMLTEKDIKSYTPDVAFPEYKSWLNSDEFKGYDPAVQTELLSDRKKLFDVWYDETVKDKRNFFDSKNEWKVAGPEYAEWASKEYQNEMLGKYGKYDLELFDLNPNISPYEGVDIKLNLANNDYMKAYKEAGGFENADPYEIGYPTEFDYGMFDRSPVEGGPGLTTAEKDRAVLGFMKPYNYNTTEAETLADNPYNVIPEMLAGGKGLQTLLSKSNKYLQKLPGSRVAREMFPGTLQYGADNFGFAKDANAYKNFGKSVINNFRRKGGQFAATMYGTDYLSDQ